MKYEIDKSKDIKKNIGKDSTNKYTYKKDTEKYIGKSTRNRSNDKKAGIWKNASYVLVSLFILCLYLYGSGSEIKVMASQSNPVTYTIKTTSAPYHNQYQGLSTYNSKTAHYYLLRSYLERLEKVGGGNLILKKGTYIITNTLYIPSKVTLLLQDGVTIQKGNDTGTTKLTATKTLFQFIAPSKSERASAVTGYLGESGITLRGEGTATIDLNYNKDTTGIVLGHNTSVNIEGITFRRMNGGSFIKLAASKNINIRDNHFLEAKASSSGSREAIALEVPDALTKSFTYLWSKADKTVNDGITIENNEFRKLERAVGTGKYTEGKYQQNIKLLNNNISDTSSHAIRILNWEKCWLEGNHFADITNQEGNLKVLLISGVKYPTITGNVFRDSDRPIQIMPAKNTNSGSDYAITYNTIDDGNKADMLKNTLLEMKEYFIRYNQVYNEFTQNTERWEISDQSVRSFTINPSSEPFQNTFKNYSTYNSSSKQYYVLRSYLEQLEKVGGGTLTLSAGTYEICNTLYVASNITIYLKDGAIIRKSEATGTTALDSSSSLFQLAAPSKSKIVGGYSGYSGEHDIQFLGEGKATIDLNYVSGAIGLILVHNSNITISGITFTNMQGGHFIELDASKSVVVEKNTFAGHKPSQTGIKEAINIDTPDRSTEGLHVDWTSYDCTPDLDVIIRNNNFKDLERAIGTHKYSGGKYHENIQILNNIIENTDSDAIRIINWKTPTITGNSISNVNSGMGTERAVLASGVIHPVIRDNTFTNSARPIQLMPWKNTGPGSQYEITYNEVNTSDLDQMLKNNLVRVGETFIRVNQIYGIYDSNTLKYYYHFQ